jgi:hypothetical protein
LVLYTDASIRLSRSVPSSSSADEAVADGQELQRELWALAGEALDSAPTTSAPRLYVDTLNEMIDMQTVRVSALNNRVPPAVLWLELVGAAVALGLLAVYLAPARGWARHALASRDFRPRPAYPRLDPRPRYTPHGLVGLDGFTSGVHPLRVRASRSLQASRTRRHAPGKASDGG